MAVKKKIMPQKMQSRKIAPKKIVGRKDLLDIDVDIQMNNSVISNDPLDFTYLFYGPKKVGKTDLTSQFAGKEGLVYFLMFEKLARHLSIRQSAMIDQVGKDGEVQPAWLVAEAYLDTLIKNPGNIRVISCDGMLAMYEKAFKQGCKEGGFVHPGGQNDYGVSWDKVKSAFYRFLDKLIETDFGLIFNCHDIAITTEQMINGINTSRTQIVPNLPRYADEFVRHKIDNVFYLHYRGQSRWLQIRGDETVYAGCASTENFLTSEGEQIYMIPMGKSAKEGYQNFLNAFNNKQRKTYKEVTKEDIAEIEKEKGETTKRTIRKKRK